jgi:hypothetical protein
MIRATPPLEATYDAEPMAAQMTPAEPSSAETDAISGAMPAAVDALAKMSDPFDRLLQPLDVRRIDRTSARRPADRAEMDLFGRRSGATAIPRFSADDIGNSRRDAVSAIASELPALIFSAGGAFHSIDCDEAAEPIADIWGQLRDGLINLSGLPAAADVVKIARGMDRSGLVACSLPIVRSWLTAFAEAYGEGSAIP